MSLKKKVAAAALTTALGTTIASGAFAAEAANTNANLLAGVDHVQWLDVNRLIASKDTDTGRVDYMVYLDTGKFEQLLDAADASELILSPDGSKAAYTDSKGAVYVLDLVTKSSKTVSTDSNIKPEVVWSTDGSAIYILVGDKGSTVSKLDLASGKITPVLEDKKDYKANLSVSTNGMTFTYTLTVPPVVTAPSDKPVDADEVTIDDSAAALNVYSFINDSSLKDNKPLQLSKTTDDKVFVGTEANGAESYYINVGSDKSSLVSVTADGKINTLFSEQDVFQARYSSGLLYALTSGPAGKNLIYTISPAGTSRILATVPDTTDEIEVSKSGLLSYKADGVIYADVDGKWKPVTR